MLPDAFSFERLVKRFDDAVLLRRVRMNELLRETVALEQVAVLL